VHLANEVEGCCCHVLILTTSKKDCELRALKRKNHEGKVDVKSMGAVKVSSIVNRMADAFVPPRMAEGFSSIVELAMNPDVANVDKTVRRIIQEGQEHERLLSSPPRPTLHSAARYTADFCSSSRVKASRLLSIFELFCACTNVGTK
jgi:hypothetical protein